MRKKADLEGFLYTECDTVNGSSSSGVLRRAALNP